MRAVTLLIRKLDYMLSQSFHASMTLYNFDLLIKITGMTPVAYAAMSRKCLMANQLLGRIKRCDALAAAAALCMERDKSSLDGLAAMD